MELATFNVPFRLLNLGDSGWWRGGREVEGCRIGRNCSKAELEDYRQLGMAVQGEMFGMGMGKQLPVVFQVQSSFGVRQPGSCVLLPTSAVAECG